MSNTGATADPEPEDLAGAESKGGAPESTKLSADTLGNLSLSGGMGKAVQAGLSGEAISGRGVLEAIGGWRGIAEALVPGLLFLIVYSFTKDEKLAVIAPAALAIIAVAIRLIRKESPISAISGAIGVGIAVAATLISGEGQGYYLPGFWINAAWTLGLLISIAVRWPVLGFAIGAFRGGLTSWRQDRSLRRVALWLTVLWLAMFVTRLAIQLPLYYSGNVEALGIARLVMGTPLFALVIIFTWMVLNRLRQSSDDSSGETVENTGETPPLA